MRFLIHSAFVILTLLSLPAFSQDKGSSYTTGIGFRAAWHPGLTVKHFFKSDAAVEAILHTRYKYRGWVLTGLYEKHAPAFGVSGMQWFYGLGAHVGSFREGYYIDRSGRLYKDRVINAGIDGILGIEYYIGDIPFTIGADIKPFFDIINPGWGYWDGAISIRYTF